MNRPAPSTYAATVLAKEELKAEIAYICFQLSKIKDLKQIVFTTKIPENQKRNYILLEDGSYEPRYRKRDRSNK